MKGELWLKKELDLQETLQHEDYEMLINYASDNQEKILIEWTKVNKSERHNIVRYGMMLMKYFEQHLPQISKDTALFRLGALAGTLEVCDRFSYEESQEHRAETLYKEQVSSIKHLDEIILALELHGIMSHSELCEYLDLKESTLSEVMKKVNLTNLVVSSKHGKYKLYRLTDAGRRLGKQLRKKRKGMEQEEWLLQLKDYLIERNDNSFAERIAAVVRECRRTENSNQEIKPGDKLEVLYWDQSGQKRTDEYEVKMNVLEQNTQSAARRKKIIAVKENINSFSNISNY